MDDNANDRNDKHKYLRKTTSHKNAKGSRDKLNVRT